MLINLGRPVSCNLGVGDGKQGPKTHLWFPMTFLLWAMREWGRKGSWREKMGMREEKTEKMNFLKGWLVPSAELEM